jgi:hypothetical protein
VVPKYPGKNGVENSSARAGRIAPPETFGPLNRVVPIWRVRERLGTELGLLLRHRPLQGTI